MASTHPQHERPPALTRVLDSVLALFVVLLGVAFWLGLAFDWWLEPSPAVRAAALVGVGLSGLYVIYRYLLRRIFVPIADSSAALLLERRFPSLHERSVC
jgi:hypothetical protein